MYGLGFRIYGVMCRGSGLVLGVARWGAGAIS